MLAIDRARFAAILAQWIRRYYLSKQADPESAGLTGNPSDIRGFSAISTAIRAFKVTQYGPYDIPSFRR